MYTYTSSDLVAAGGYMNMYVCVYVFICVYIYIYMCVYKKQATMVAAFRWARQV